MTHSLGRWLLFYGIFLIVCGVAGYLSNPEKARSALMSGGSFGLISIIWGVLAMKGMAWARTAAMVTTALMIIATGWRSVVSWKAVSGGDSTKMIAAVLVSLMCAASVAMFVCLIKAGGNPSGPRKSEDKF